MSDVEIEIFCSNCGGRITDPPGVRSSCPACGRGGRTIRLTAAASVQTGGSQAPAPATGTAAATGTAYPATVKITEALGAHEATIRYEPLGDDGSLFKLDVLRNGEIIASGVGDDHMVALFAVVLKLLPPGHEAYEPDDDG